MTVSSAATGLVVQQWEDKFFAEYLQTLTADAQGSVPFTYGRGFSGATSSGISLRGLGANATLVVSRSDPGLADVLPTADFAQLTRVLPGDGRTSAAPPGPQAP
mgnify:CR=1 FL=1